MGCDDYNLYAIYPDGSLRWKYLTGGTISLPVIGSDGTIYMGCDDYNLYAIYPNGDLRWKYLIKLSDQIYPAPTFLPVIGSDGTIYIGCGYNLYAIYPDGSLRWTWSNDIPAGIPVSPFLIGGDGTIYLAVVGEQFCWNYCNTCYMVAIYPDGSLKWNYLIGNYQPYDIAIIGSDGIICLTNNILTRNILISNILYAIYPNGSLRWSYSFSNQTSVSFLGGSDGTIYVGSQDGNLYAIYPDGSLKWKYLTVSPGWVVYPLVIGSDGIIYVGSLYGNLYAIYPDGSLKWKYPIGGGSLSSVMGSDGTLYVGTYGNLYAISAGLIPATPIPTSVYEHTKTFTQTPLSFETITSTPTRVCGLVSPFEYAYLSNMVYGEVESVLNDNFPGWKVVPTSISFSNGFYGQLFNKSGTYVFAVRGTDNIGNLLTDIWVQLHNGRKSLIDFQIC
jgi:outer membrane protein assembly factor BamB